MTSAQVSAVIVAWNAGDTLAACVESLRLSAHDSATALQVVVVDNASGDEAVDHLELEPGDVVIRNAVNAGYGVAATQGMARSEAPWILLVNPDLVVEPTFFDALLDAAGRAGPDVSTLVPELRFAARPDIVNCRGLTVDEVGIPAEVDAGAHSERDPVSVSTILGGSSGCCLLRAEHVRAVGGPEPAFFAYLEDADLALRLRCAGFGVAFVPAAIALHEGSAATGATSPLKVHLVARNRRLLFRLHGPRSLRATGWRTVIDLAHAAYSTAGTPLAPWAGRLEALRFRSYTHFLRRSRGRRPCVGTQSRPARFTLRETLSRKRRVLHRDG